jgi:hypothetical protein
MNRGTVLTTIAVAILAGFGFANCAEIEPGELITRDNAAQVANLVSPGNYFLVRQGMEMKIVPTKDYEWPAPYKNSTEQYSPQVKLGSNGELQNYRAGQPFPLLDPNDPHIAQKIMWNYQLGPSFSDDLDAQDDEIANYAPGHSGVPWSSYYVGHLAVYRNIGRNYVLPVPTDYDGNTGIMQRMAVGPIVVPRESPSWQPTWLWFVWYRYSDPEKSDLVWSAINFGWANWPGPNIGPSDYLTGSSFFGNLDLQSLFGFAGRFEDFDFKFLGEKEILAVVHAASLPAQSCAADGGRTICPENWELRHVYVVEAKARRPTRYADTPPIAKRIFYIDSQGWFITASDQYDHRDTLWKTLAIFNTVRDREYPESKAAVYSFDHLLQTALVDEDVQSGYSTVLFTPSPNRARHDTWFVDQGIISQRWIVPQRFTTFREYFY